MAYSHSHKIYTLKEVSMGDRIARFIRDEEGTTAIEYGLIAALVSIVIIVVLGSVGSSLNDVFTAIDTALSNAASSAGS
jgi:pilus assembly protein Flp/PilA